MQLKIKADYDKGIISVDTGAFNGDIPLIDFAKLSAQHISTGRSMFSLCEEYIIYRRI